MRRLAARCSPRERVKTPVTCVLSERRGKSPARVTHRSPARTADGAGGDYSRDLELLLRRASEIERDVVVQARRRGDVSAEAADIVLQDVEARSVRDLD